MSIYIYHMSISIHNVYIWKHRFLRIDQCLRGPNPQHHRRIMSYDKAKRIAFSAMDHPKLQWVSRFQYMVHKTITFPETNIADEVGHKETIVFQPSIFQVLCYVSSCESIGCNMFQGAYSPWDIYPNIPPCAGTCWWQIPKCKDLVPK